MNLTSSKIAKLVTELKSTASHRIETF